jgi:hypothetical protein
LQARQNLKEKKRLLSFIKDEIQFDEFSIEDKIFKSELFNLTLPQTNNQAVTEITDYGKIFNEYRD